MDADPQRARTEAAKQARRERLLEAAAELALTQPYPAVTLAQVARAAGLAKGTLFLYFPTKESLFLELAAQSLSEWFDETEDWLLGVGQRPVPGEVAQVFVDGLEKRPLLLRLLPLLHGVLAPNLAPPQAEKFQTFLATWAKRNGRVLESVLPFLPRGEGSRALLALHTLSVGYACAAQTLGEDLFSDLKRAWEALLLGLAIAPST